MSSTDQQSQLFTSSASLHCSNGQSVKTAFPTQKGFYVHSEENKNLQGSQLCFRCVENIAWQACDEEKKRSQSFHTSCNSILYWINSVPGGTLSQLQHKSSGVWTPTVTHRATQFILYAQQQAQWLSAFVGTQNAFLASRIHSRL